MNRDISNNNEVINVKDLLLQINNNNLIIIDCRFDLKDKEYGFESYMRGHIPGAKFLNIETELSGKVQKHGGRHPLPDIKDIHNTLENKGITPNFDIVIYDDGDLAGACRARLILKYLGFKKVKVLNGGFNEYIRESSVNSKYSHTLLTKNFDVEVKKDIFVDMNYVKERVDNKNVAIVDCREPNRYKGIVEPVDFKKGHIPNAINYYWEDIIDKSTNLIKDKHKLEEYFSELNNFEEIILYCGSGITASVVSLGLDIIGRKHKIYTGGFSDWITYDDNEVIDID